MLTEVAPVYFAVKINGVIAVPNLPSRLTAETIISNLPADQRLLAEVVPMTSDGKTVLFG